VTQGFSFEDFLTRARARLHNAPPPEQNTIGDAATDPSLAPFIVPGPPRPAAVLIGITEGADPTVILTQRTAALRAHAGQIAFPGGRIEEGEGPVEAALREAREEVGLDPEAVAPVAFLDAYRTTTGYRVVPVLATVQPPASYAPDPAEVDEVFEVPLAFLMDPANHRTDSREWKGMMRRYHVIPFGSRYICGVTAGILKNLHARLYGPWHERS
jgi:8-oxo-dGTP pyrophosphatase MutT (NUDIX family)